MVVLLAALVSLVAFVVPSTPTVVSGVSVPPSAPGITTVTRQVSVAATGNAAAEPLDAVHTPVVTVAPAGTPAVATQVALMAVEVPTLVQVIVPLTVAPGAATVGRPAMATLMSVPVAVTVSVAVSHWVVFGAGAQTW